VAESGANKSMHVSITILLRSAATSPRLRAQTYGDVGSRQKSLGTIKGKQAIRDVGRVLGMSFAETDKNRKLIPRQAGRDFPLPSMRWSRGSSRAQNSILETFTLRLQARGLLRHASARRPAW